MERVRSDAEYHRQVVALMRRLGDVLVDGEENGVGINALIAMLAVAGHDSPLTQKEYCEVVAAQLNHLMSTMTIDPKTFN